MSFENWEIRKISYQMLWQTVPDCGCGMAEGSFSESRRQENRWLSAEAVQAKRTRRRLERKWRSTKDIACYTEYRKVCRSANKAIVESRRNFYRQRIDATETDPRKRWATVRDLLHQTESPEVLSTDDCQRLSNAFADFFVDKVSRIKLALKSSLNEATVDPLQSDISCTGDIFADFLPPTVEEVSKLISWMPAKSSAMDYIPTSVIKSSVNIFAPLIARLAALSFREGVFPTRYKTASVTPLLKKKGLDRDVLNNYRPISNLHTISKVIERISMSRILSHVERSPSYSRFQSAYRRGYSTETSILRLLNDVYRAADAKSRTVLLQLDLSAAFDTIDKTTLVDRLEKTFGISGTALRWINSYLTNRHQVVRVGNACSTGTECQFGVPQGSVLGPLLFSLYVAPIADVIKKFSVSYAQYADDTQLYISLSDRNALSLLSDCFQAVHNWFTANGLSLNPEKSEAIVIGTSARQRTQGSLSNITVGNITLQPAKCVKSLGVIIDDTLSFNAHVDSVCKAAYFHIRALRQLRFISYLIDLCRVKNCLTN
jgi:hypothetical protein